MNTNFQKISVSEEATKKMIIAAQDKAKEIGIGISVYIVDESAVIKAFSRMDNDKMVTVDAARKKAITAVGFGRASGEWWYNHIKDDPILFNGIQQFQDFILLGGGLPIIIDGMLAGAIGISGGSYKQDEVCAQAALDVLL